MRVVSSQRSVVRKSIFAATLSALLFAICVSAQAQQPEKAFRIGFLDTSTPSGMAVMVDAFRQTSLAGLKKKTSPLSTDLPSIRMSGYLSLPRS